MKWDRSALARAIANVRVLMIPEATTSDMADAAIDEIERQLVEQRLVVVSKALLDALTAFAADHKAAAEESKP